MSSKRWLVLFNCQGFGLANCISTLAADVEVEAFAFTDADKVRDDLQARMHQFHLLITMPNAPAMFKLDVTAIQKTITVPIVFFRGYQPDMCYLATSGPLSKGPMGVFHSAIAYAAFRAGLAEADACRLFCRDTYEKMGYLDDWAAHRNALVEEFSNHGFDIRHEFVKWSRRGPFMHTFNHPNINVLMGLARMILDRVGETVQSSGVVPHDNLSNGPVYPVYPEIGIRKGVAGSYTFKIGGRYRTMQLEQFVSGSYRAYREAGSAEPTHKQFAPLLSRAMEVVGN